MWLVLPKLNRRNTPTPLRTPHPPENPRFETPIPIQSFRICSRNFFPAIEPKINRAVILLYATPLMVTETTRMATRIARRCMAAPTSFWGSQGAGILPIAESTGRILVALRSSHVNEPNTYGVWGGAIEPGEDPKQAAKRELQEEARYSGSLKLVPAYVYSAPDSDFKYFNYLGIVADEFTPRMDWETQGYEWLTYDELLRLSPKHYGLKGLIQNSGSLIRKYSEQSKTAAYYEGQQWSRPDRKIRLSNLPDAVYEDPAKFFWGLTPRLVRLLHNIRNKPGTTVTVYRASTEPELNRGDWVALRQDYAESYEIWVTKPEEVQKMQIYEWRVKAGDLYVGSTWGKAEEGDEEWTEAAKGGIFRSYIDELGYWGPAKRNPKKLKKPPYQFKYRFTKRAARTVTPPTQYHATSKAAAEKILANGFKRPTASSVATHMYETPSISTSDDPEDVKYYGPVILEVEVKPGARYLHRDWRKHRRDSPDGRGYEDLETTMNRWLKEADEGGYDGVYIDELQSTVGNQTLNPRVLTPVRILQ